MTVVSPLASKIKDLTEEPGVYLMKERSGEILYIGKAKNLRNRVSSYFQENRGHTARIRLLVRRIEDFDIIITDNEAEALVLECNLIKKHKPRFNVRLKDDKAYPYVRLDVKHSFPRVEFIRRVKKDGARYFGPFISSLQLREVLTWARKTFRLRDCTDNEFRNRVRPCLLYQIQQCSAPCVGYVQEDAYQKSIQYVLQILEGKTKDVLRDLGKEMALASEEEAYEKAAQIRDQMAAIQELERNEQKMIDPESDLSRDVIQMARDGSIAVVVILSVRGGKTVGVAQYPLSDLDPELEDSTILFDFLAQYYIERQEKEGTYALEEVLLSDESQVSAMGDQYRVLRRALNGKIDFRVPKRGEAAELVSLVLKTAQYNLTELQKTKSRGEDDLKNLQMKLNLKNYPRRIECYDISHFQGEGTVASRVVFTEGKPEKELYRHYHVESVEGPDDFASLREILMRRFSAMKTPLPDLVVIDGGRGQLAQAEAVFAELQINGVDLVSLAKARTESDFQSSEVKASLERVFKPNQKNPILLKPGTGAYRVLTHARDESHRFAITFHRKVRDRRRV